MARKSKIAPKAGGRVSFTLPPEMQERLTEVKELAGLTSNIDVIRNALVLYEDYVKSPAEGYIYVRKKMDADSAPVFINVARQTAAA